MSDLGIDDLLRLGDDDLDAADGDDARPRSRGWLVVRNVVLVAAGTLVVLGITRSAGIAVSPLIVVAAVLAVRLLVAAVVQVAPPQLPRARRGAPGPDDPAAGPDVLRAAVARWERLLDAPRGDPGRFTRTVLPALRELADERLLHRHGVTRGTDPRRAAQLLGAPLCDLLDGAAGPPRPGELAAYVETLEKL